jgi:dTDP-L-rhamnose 4-epimerase
VESDAAGLVANVCTGRPASVVDIARGLARDLGADLEPEVAGTYRAGDIRHCIGDPARARAALGFEAEVGLDAGLAALAGWMAEQEAVDRVEDALEELRRRGLER